jgi:SAM-dependent methyltransferase
MAGLDATYWAGRYRTGETGWDIGHASTPLAAYADQLAPKDLRILVPGAGRAYEAEHLHRSGFTQVFVIDLTDAPFRDLRTRCPSFPEEHLLVGDFFTHEGRYDRILEQTFFCALDPALRPRYVQQMHRLLVPGGRLVGVLFDDPLNTDRPPFGGNEAEYRTLFTPLFPDLVLEPCYNSIAPRAGRELWLRATRA